MTTIQISVSDKSLVKKIEEYVQALQFQSPLEVVEFEELDDTQYLSQNMKLKTSILEAAAEPLEECSSKSPF